MTAPLWASLVLAAFGAVALLFQTQPPMRAGAVLAFVAAVGLAAARLFPLAAAAVLLGAWLWRGGSVGRRSVSGAGSSAGPSEVASAGLRMTLDRATGEMEGEVLTGPEAGRRLSELSPAEIRGLAAGFRAEGDEESLSLLRAWLERAGRGDEAAAPAATGEMTQAEAYRVLGLAPGASLEEVRAAYRRLMRRVHPDLGGSSALAALLNAAKDVLDPG